MENWFPINHVLHKYISNISPFRSSQQI